MSGAPLGIQLAIDGASDDASVGALDVTADGERVLAERLWTVESTVSRELLASVDDVMREAGVARSDLAAIVVNVGPGRFSGLRASVATAQGIALALDLPLAPVRRFEAAALPHLEAQAAAPARPVVAVHAMGRGRIGWAAYAALDPRGLPQPLEEMRLDELDDCIARAPRGALWCGEVEADLRAALEAADPAAEVVAGAKHRRPLDLVRLARRHGAYGPPEATDALYLRPPSITQPRR